MSCVPVAGDDSDEICANCGKQGSDTVKLKSCTACRLVKYCGVECQRAHRKQHKKACKQHAAKLEDELLLAAPEHRLVIEMELGELKLKHGLLTAAERQAHLTAHPRTDTWSRVDVREFLDGQGLGAYAANFAQVDGQTLVAMSEAQLQVLTTGGGSDETDQATFELLSAQVRHLRERTSSRMGGLKSEL